MLENKWFRAAIPALLIHICIGSVYCWSLLKDEIALLMNCSVSSIEFAFSLAIFFLGMSAAFAGNFVEKNVKASSGLSCIFFTLGLMLSIISIYNQSIIGLMVSYGCIMGIGLGIGYLSPVKTLMLWFSEHKGLATGIAISGFGLSKVIFSPFIEWCNSEYSALHHSINGEKITLDNPNPEIAIPVAKPLCSLNHNISVFTGDKYPIPSPIPIIQP